MPHLSCTQASGALSEELALFGEQAQNGMPLAHRMRPTDLAEFLGQQHLLAPGKPLRERIERGTVSSMVFWGPPGCGKTTLAGLIANYTDREFVPFSAVTSGIPRVREIIAEAKTRLDATGRGTILFCDEIHRFNKAQQDAFLPHVEAGTITLVGATTENPSFELNSALLSRLRVFVLEPIETEHLKAIIGRAMRALAADDNRTLQIEDDALELLAKHADGDARRALNLADAVWQHAAQLDDNAVLTAPFAADVLERRVARYDKNGEEHYNLISALHKSIRGSDVDGALYWLARMLAGGEEPLYLLRRLVRMATEDIGLTDPRALSISLAAKDTFLFLGSPEGELAIAEAVVYLATAPKSNAVYAAWNKARQAAQEYPAEGVPMHLRNAPTKLMSGIGYGKGYRYDHAEGGFAAGQQYLPDALAGQTWYVPTQFGFEKTIDERLKWWARMKKEAANE
jgi:putative ATPase